MPSKVYTRDELIAICEAALVPQDRWHDRDSYRAQLQVGTCWALLRAGCDFEVITRKTDKDRVRTDGKTIWLRTYGQGFRWHEYDWEGYGESVRRRDEYLDVELHYLPTEKRLREAAGGDWY